MLSIYISVYIFGIFSIYIHISAAIRAIRKIPEDAVQREGGCVSCYSGDSGSYSALLFRRQRVTFCPVIPETAGHVLPCYTIVCPLLLFYTLRKSPSIAKAWFMGPLPLPRSSIAARAPEM